MILLDVNIFELHICVCELLQLNKVTSTNAGDLRLGLSFSYQFEAAGPGVSVLQWQSGDSHWDQSIQDEQPATLSASFEWCTYTSGTNCGTIAILSLHILGKTPSKPNACCYRKAWWMGCASFVGPLDRILPSMYEPQKSGGILRSWQLAWWVDSKLKIFVFFVAVWLQSPTLRSFAASNKTPLTSQAQWLLWRLWLSRWRWWARELLLRSWQMQQVWRRTTLQKPLDNTEVVSHVVLSCKCWENMEAIRLNVKSGPGPFDRDWNKGSEENGKVHLAWPLYDQDPQEEGILMKLAPVFPT